jgi:hypothetical protein
LRGRFALAEVLIDPFHPSALNVPLAHRILRAVAADRIGEEPRLDTVVFQRVIELVRFE